MAELNAEAVRYALQRYTNEVNDVVYAAVYEGDEDVEVLMEKSDIDNFLNDYADYERNSWLTTQG